MEHPPIKPPALRSGDTIGIAAPASPFDEQAFETGVSVLGKAVSENDTDDYTVLRQLADHTIGADLD